MSLAFLNFYNTFRSKLADPMNLDWILHTHLGPFYMLRLEWEENSGVVCIHCHDAGGTYRFLAFTDEQLLGFPLEVKKKAVLTALRESIGFKVSGRGEDVTSNDINSREVDTT